MILNCKIDDLSLSDDGLILNNDRLFVPISLRDEVMKYIHDSHLGVAKCKSLARNLVWWPKMNADIENYRPHHIFAYPRNF